MKIKKHFEDLQDKYGYIPYNKISTDIMKEIEDNYKTIEDAVKDLIPDSLQETKDKNEIKQYFEDYIMKIGYIPDTSFNRKYKIKRSISNKITKYYSTPENIKNREVLKSCIKDLMDNPEELIKTREEKLRSLKKKPSKRRRNYDHNKLINEWIDKFKKMKYIPSDPTLELASQETRDFLNSRRIIYKNKADFINDNDLHKLNENSDYKTPLKERIIALQDYLGIKF